jgi:hypothetical protein
MQTNKLITYSSQIQNVFWNLLSSVIKVWLLNLRLKILTHVLRDLFILGSLYILYFITLLFIIFCVFYWICRCFSFFPYYASIFVFPRWLSDEWLKCSFGSNKLNVLKVRVLWLCGLDCERYFPHETTVRFLVTKPSHPEEGEVLS